MKALIIVIFMSVSIQLQSQQVADGRRATDFTIESIQDATEYNLYELLDSGKYVFVDFFASWCPPCISFHNKGTFKELHNTYGPGTETDNVRLFSIDIDILTTENDVRGTGSNTVGDYVTGTPYPVANPDSTTARMLHDTYGPLGYPTVFMICPDRTIKYVDTELSVDAMYDLVENSACAPKLVVDGSIEAYTGAKASCNGELNISFDFKNYGWEPITQSKINVLYLSDTVFTIDWTGNLETFETVNVDLGSVELPAGADKILIDLDIEGDTYQTNNSFTGADLAVTPIATTTDSIIIELNTDSSVGGNRYTWYIENEDGEIIASNSDIEINANSTHTDVVELEEGICYTFYLINQFGSENQSSSHRILDKNGNELFEIGFRRFLIKSLFFDKTLNTKNIYDENSLVYPNPVDNDLVNVKIDLPSARDLSIMLINAHGQIVYSENFTNVGNLHQQIDTKNYSAGIYNLVISDKKDIKNHKIVIVK